MNEQQRRAWDELRRVVAHFETDWDECLWNGWKLPVRQGYHQLIAVATYLDEAGGAREVATGRLLFNLAEVILELAAQLYGDGDGGPDPDKPSDPPPPLPSEILNIFKKLVEA